MDDWYERVCEELRDSHDTHAHELLQEMIDAIDDGVGFVVHPPAEEVDQ